MATIPQLSETEFNLWTTYLENVCGIHLSTQKAYLFSGKLLPLLQKYNCTDYAQLFQKTKNDFSKSFENEVIEAMTTNETLWFRDAKPFIILEDVIKKELVKNTSTIKIWSAACSYGQEPYSIAITILELQKKGINLSPGRFEIVATDIDQQVLNIAKAGVYDSLAISRGLTIDMRTKYFDSDGKNWKIKDSVKKMVTFQKLNLKDSFTSLGKKDIIFCRNVCIYFSEQFKKDIFTRISSLLRPSGFLFLGAAESLSTYSNDFQLLTNFGGIYYKVK